MEIVINGCFDMFHDGHQDLLDWAWRLIKDSNDYTITFLVNSDESIKQLKGPSRPKETFNVRENKLFEKALSLHRDEGTFDIIQFSSEEELDELMDRIEPDLILKGEDWYDTRQIVGYGKHPICILPRIKKDGKYISTTENLKDKQ